MAGIDFCTTAQTAEEAKKYEYERGQLIAAQQQKSALDPWRDSKGNITDFGGLAGTILKAPAAVSSQDLVDVQRRLLSLLSTVNELLARIGVR